MATDSSTLDVRTGPHLNALKHGMRSNAILLPGDDAAEFQRLRRQLFTDYQPLTRDEADCVESMAGYKWQIARAYRWKAAFAAHVDALVMGGPHGHICEPDPHRWQHRGMDCVLEAQRLHRLLSKDRATLIELQRMRRHRLIDGAIVVSGSYLDFLEEPATPEEDLGQPPSTGDDGAAPASGSGDGEIGEVRERTAAPAAATAVPAAPAAMSPVLARVLKAREERLRRSRRGVAHKERAMPAPAAAPRF